MIPISTEEISRRYFYGRLSSNKIYFIASKQYIPANFDGYRYTFYDEKLEEWKNTFVGSFIMKYPNRTTVLDAIVRAIHRQPEFSDFTKRTLVLISRQLETDFSKGSAKMYASLIKSVLNENKEDFDIPCTNMKPLSIKGTSTINVYLTKNEISRIERYNPENEIEESVRAQFLVSCFTGARHSDVNLLDNTNIYKGYCVYISKKTGIRAAIPEHKKLREYLSIANKRSYSDMTFNRTIKEICRKCRISEESKIYKGGEYYTGEKWRFVSSHTARRSFVTNLYLLGVDIYDISKMAGHSSVEMTERYICCERKKLSEQAMQYFK